jgi:hypothetical protein
MRSLAILVLRLAVRTLGVGHVAVEELAIR